MKVPASRTSVTHLTHRWSPPSFRFHFNPGQPRISTQLGTMVWVFRKVFQSANPDRITERTGAMTMYIRSMGKNNSKKPSVWKCGIRNQNDWPVTPPLRAGWARMRLSAALCTSPLPLLHCNLPGGTPRLGLCQTGFGLLASGSQRKGKLDTLLLLNAMGHRLAQRNNSSGFFRDSLPCSPATLRQSSWNRAMFRAVRASERYPWG